MLRKLCAALVCLGASGQGAAREREYEGEVWLNPLRQMITTDESRELDYIGAGGKLQLLRGPEQNRLEADVVVKGGEGYSDDENFNNASVDLTLAKHRSKEATRKETFAVDLSFADSTTSKNQDFNADGEVEEALIGDVLDSQDRFQWGGRYDRVQEVNETDKAHFGAQYSHEGSRLFTEKAYLGAGYSRALTQRLEGELSLKANRYRYFPGNDDNLILNTTSLVQSFRFQLTRLQSAEVFGGVAHEDFDGSALPLWGGEYAFQGYKSWFSIGYKRDFSVNRFNLRVYYSDQFYSDFELPLTGNLALSGYGEILLPSDDAPDLWQVGESRNGELKVSFYWGRSFSGRAPFENRLSLVARGDKEFAPFEGDDDLETASLGLEFGRLF